MSSKPTLGIVVPVCNEERLLSETLSHLLQIVSCSPVGVDVVVVDDGSDDASAAVVGMFGPPVRLVRKLRGGVSSARNSGIAELATPVIAMLDADDRFTEAAIAEVLPFILQPDTSPIVQGRLQDWHPEHANVQLSLGPPYRSVNLGTAMFRREVFDHVGGFDERHVRHEDYDWFLRAFDLRIPKTNIEAVTLHYRRRPDGLSVAPPGDSTLARIHGAAIKRRRIGLAALPEGFPAPSDYFGVPPGARGAKQPLS